MGQALIFLSAEVFKIVMNHLSQQGSLNSLTQAQAEVLVQKLAAGLPSLLPTPTELENPTPPAA